MSPFDVHINVQVGLQELNANSNRDIQPEEIDLAVNICINRFINSHIKPNSFNPKGFSGTQKDLDSISNLITSKELVPFFTTRFNLPQDYYHRLSGKASVFETCDPDLNKLLEATTKKIIILPFNLSSKPEAPFYKTVVLTRESEIIYDSSIDTPNAQDINSREEISLVKDVMLTKLREKGYEVYWETFKNIRKPNSFIFVDTTLVSYNLAVDAFSVDGIFLEDMVFTRYVLKEKNWRPAAKVRDDQVENIPSTFVKSDYNEVLYLVENDMVQIIPDKSIIVNEFELRYIRKPRRFSVILNQGIDLPESVHPDIVDLTIEYLSGIIGKENLQWKTQDNQLSVKQI